MTAFDRTGPLTACHYASKVDSLTKVHWYLQMVRTRNDNCSNHLTLLQQYIDNEVRVNSDLELFAHKNSIQPLQETFDYLRSMKFPVAQDGQVRVEPDFSSKR